MLPILIHLFLACNTEQKTPDVNPNNSQPSSPTSGPEEAMEEPEEEPATAPDISGETVGQGQLYPTNEEPHRNKKRMSVAQIKASMEKVSGGITWKSGNQFLWEKYSRTLGVPDYQQSVTEDLSPSIMFQKFLDDAAVHTCANWINNEINGDERLFFSEIEPTETDALKTRLNIAYLQQRIHGQKIDPSTNLIDSYVELHELVMQRTSNLQSAWKTVCVGFFTHPDFYIY